jgi:hypothetical protein
VSNTETFTSTEKKPVQFQESNKPNYVLLIGTSNVMGVHETRLSASLNIKKFVFSSLILPTKIFLIKVDAL